MLDVIAGAWVVGAKVPLTLTKSPSERGSFDGMAGASQWSSGVERGRGGLIPFGVKPLQ